MDADIPTDLVSLVQACWESDPELRPCLQDVIDELTRIETLPANDGRVAVAGCWGGLD